MTDRAFKCPCGKRWPCKCSKARRILGISGKPIHPEDDNIVALCRCPSCGNDAFLEVDAEDVVGWTADTNIVLEVAPPMGTCCKYVFSMMPGGHVQALIDDGK